MCLLKITDLWVEVEGKPILKGLNLTINKGEVHALMGPNGTGKSTLAAVLAGKEGYEVVQGKILYKNQDLLAMEPEERAREGLFLAFQYPVELPGVSNANFLKTAINEIRKHQGKEPLDTFELLARMKKAAAALRMPENLLSRSVNTDFSGGEKKRNEILQMMLLEPTLAILDETDSGLDIDALKIVAEAVNQLRSPERAFLIITHYQRLLNFIIPDFVHILYDGKIVKSGDKQLAIEVENQGYDWLKSA